MIRAADSEAGTATSSSTFAVADRVAGLRVAIVNCYFVGDAEQWVLIDAGLPLSTQWILGAAHELFGAAARPEAIVMTHGHFDHVGALVELSQRWDVPVYAHELELPYLTGRSSYPAPDPTVGGGMMSRLSYLYPRGPVDVGARAQALPADGTVPGMPGWGWIHTPGHAPGHVSFWREADRCLIAGDAFVTTVQESATSALTQQPVEVHGPPKYFTQDWPAAQASVQRLADLEPEIAATGHGLPMYGEQLRGELRELAENFANKAVPPKGRYVNQPVVFDANGPVSVPPPVTDLVSLGTLAAVTLASAAITSAMIRSPKDQD